jgi:uncharacterized SAM-binding protein YcdF (DUF218 family)
MPKTGGGPQVITVFVEDPWRTFSAIKLHQRRPGSILVMQGSPRFQEINRSQLVRYGQWPPGMKPPVILTAGCDTFGQLTTLALWLEQQPNHGDVTIVTSPAHLGRALAIGHIVLGSLGWSVTGVAASTGDNRYETPLRTLRDQVRAQIWRSTRWNPIPVNRPCL